jgi:hypothetical protein
MQLMTWTLSRLGSRFGFVFEPYRRRVMHSALGRFLDEPMDLMVGLIEPDGVRRVLPLSQDGQLLTNCEQFERFNSITYRGYSEKYRLRFEFNIHSTFYPQDEPLCIMPAFYLEMRINPVPKVRWAEPVGKTPEEVELFIRLRRPQTSITATADPGEMSRLDLAYTAPLRPTPWRRPSAAAKHEGFRHVAVQERLVSLNPNCTCLDDGDGLCCKIPVTEEGSGIKWRLVWGAHTGEPVLQVRQQGEDRPARFRYCAHWSDVAAVVEDAVKTRDDNLALSRRFEKLLEQAPLRITERHLVNQSFQNFVSNTFWCDTAATGPETSAVTGRETQWFSCWEGSSLYHATIDVEYNQCLLYLAIWPDLLAMQFDQWVEQQIAHEPSGGAYLSHDMGGGPFATGQAYSHPMPVEENCNFLLMLDAFSHWTGNTAPAVRHAPTVERLARYLLWTDRDASGFPGEGVANTIDDASPALQFGRKQTYLAVKRLCALRAVTSLLAQANRPEVAKQCEQQVRDDIVKVESAAWLADHYAVVADRSTMGIVDPWTGKPLPYEELPGWDAYSIYTGNGELLPLITGQPPLLDAGRLRKDLHASYRENISRYGCGHTSAEPENVRVSQNLWRDLLHRYLGGAALPFPPYWDLQVMSNTHEQSFGFIDTYINSQLCFYPRGVVSIGLLLAGPRLIIDRLAPSRSGAYITVDPSRDTPQRWPLLPLADWKAGKIPVCVVDDDGNVAIEASVDPVVIHGEEPEQDLAASDGLIG